MRIMLVAAAGALILTACPADPPDGEPVEEPPEEPTPSPEEPTPSPEEPTESPEEPTEEPPEEPAALAQDCTNPDGFTISYPEGWVTNEEQVDGLPACSLFDAVSVELDESMHVPESIAVNARIQAVDFARASEPEFEEVLDRRDTTIDGRDAVRLETEATGEGFHDAGHVLTIWLVDLGDQTFTAVTHDVEAVDYAANQETLDAMVESVRFDV